MLEIDGSYHEGGGQILRTAAALSVVTKKPIHVFNIRKNRSEPGLKTQHLEGIKALADSCGAKLDGAKIGSTEIRFEPGDLFKKEIDIKIPTAGSIGLLFQTLKIPFLHSKHPVTVNVDGGATFNKWAPPVPYTQHVLLPILEKMGCKIDIEIDKHGFYPVGGAKVKMKFEPCKKIKPLMLEDFGSVKKISGLSVASTHLGKARVAERQAESALKLIEQAGYKTEITSHTIDTKSPGSGIILWVTTTKGAIFGSDILGERGSPAEYIGNEVAKELLKNIETESTTDEHLCDQILPFMALADGESIITTPKITAHSETNIWVIKKFLNASFSVEKQEKNFRIVCSV